MSGIMNNKREARVLAFDLGASSGRAILGTYKDGTLTAEEVCRFKNEPVYAGGHLRWNFGELLSEIKKGIDEAGAFDSVGFDTWGVDFGLLDKNGELLEDPVNYRDGRTAGMCEKVSETVPRAELYAGTGSQIMPINTLFQLMALKSEQPELLEKADRLLFMPDLFAYALCGSAVCEQTIASTSQMLDPVSKSWNRGLLEKLGLPARLLLPTVQSGAAVGSIKLKDGSAAKVIAVAGHDTQCAVAAMPSQSENAAFLSCGTWSLFGTELDSPVLTEKSMELGLSNETGADGRTNYLKNIIGLWLIQECRRCWREQGLDLGFEDIAKEAERSPSLRSFIDPDAEEFSAPGDMPERIKRYCAKTGQYVPRTVGEISRCIYESLALKYRFALDQLRDVTKKDFSVLHILGGGSNASLLCRMTADACKIPVVAGPAEATALGNIIIQLCALGCLKDISEGRRLISRTQAVTRYEPDPESALAKSYERYRRLIETNSRP